MQTETPFSRAFGGLFLSLLQFFLRFSFSFKRAGLSHDPWLFQLVVSLDHHGAFHALLLDFAGNMIGLMDVAGKSLIIGMTAAGAEEFCPAVHTFRLGEYMVGAEIVHHLHILQPFVHIAQHIAFPAYKLVAGINVAIRHHSQVFMAGAAAAETFGKAGTLPEIHIEMEEEAYVFSLGKRVEPLKEVRTGGVYPSGHNWADIDLLLTCDTVKEAVDLSKSRHND